MPWFDLKFEIVTEPDHTHICLFNLLMRVTVDCTNSKCVAIVLDIILNTRVVKNLQ